MMDLIKDFLANVEFFFVFLSDRLQHLPVYLP